MTVWIRNHVLKIDAVSDMTILNSKFVEPRCHRIPLDGRNLKYRTGEDVPIKFKTVVRIDLGQHSVQMIVFVADIFDDCILGCDFLSETGITESINKIFQNTSSTIDRMLTNRNVVGLSSGLRNYQIC